MINSISRWRVFLNYAITYLLIGFSDISFFDYNRKARMAFFVLLGFLFFYYRKKIGKDLLILAAASIYLILFQTLYFGGGTLFTTVTLISLLVVMPYFAVKIIGPNFLKYYRDVMVAIALISMGFWIAVNVSSGLHSAIQSWAISLGTYYNPEFGIYNDNIIVYSYEEMEHYGFLRNPGPFHEPGAFSVFLMLAIISEIFITGKLISRFNLLFVIVAFYVYTTRRMTLLTKVFVSASMLAVLIYLFMTLEFLGDKISSQMEEQTESRLTTATSGRFLGARKALVVIYRYPLFGRGLVAASKASATSEEAAGYGWITWVSQIGIILGLIYMFYLYKSLRNYSEVNLRSKLFALFAFGAMLAVLSGQKHTNSLVFFVLFLMPIAFPYYTYWQDYLIRPEKKPPKKKKTRILGFGERAHLSRVGIKRGVLSE